MGKVYDDWEKLVEAVLRREKLRQLCYAHSATSSSDSSSVRDHDYLHLFAETTMARLQEQLIYTLTQNKQCFEHGYSSPLASDSSVASPRQSISSDTEDCEVELLDPDTIPEVKAIAGKMFASNCDLEFREVFVRFGKAAFDVYFTILGVEELSCEDVGLMEWKSLRSTVNKWQCAIKKFIVLYLYKARLVFDQVLGEYGDASSSCLIEASKPSLMWFLNFGRDLALGPYRPENLFCLLDMYEDLIELIPSLKALFSNEMGSCVLDELHNLLSMLEDSVKAMLTELVNSIHTNPSSIPFPNGGIHPLTRYVMNYICCFEEYDRTLCSILKEKGCEDASVDKDDEQSIISGPLATHLHLITSALEAKIANMSGLYGDDTSLEHIFVMNNIHYVVEKISSSKIKTYFGDEWIRRRTMDFRVRALSYERSTWSSILPLLRLDGKVDRATARARCRAFTKAFGNVHEKQTRWLVPSLELRQDLRISASITLVNAYQSFLGSVKNVLGNKHIKYSVRELETLTLDLFEGSSISTPNNSQMEQNGHKEIPS